MREQLALAIERPRQPGDQLRNADGAYIADPVKVRGKLQAVLAKARAASVIPWKESEFRMWMQIVPQMVNWLPDDEAAAIVREFTEEAHRLARATRLADGREEHTDSEWRAVIAYGRMKAAAAARVIGPGTGNAIRARLMISDYRRRGRMEHVRLQDGARP